MKQYRMIDSKLKKPQLMKIYEEEMANLGYENNRLNCIFDRCCASREFFPVCRKRDVDDERKYIKNWIINYKNSIENLPSMKTAKPKKACSDPALATMVLGTGESTKGEIDRIIKYHELLMRAENCLGELLEEYIYHEIEKNGADIAWCAGKSVVGVDFCTQSDAMQIKNKYNTENSSSRKAREILKVDIWFRIKGEQQDRKPIYNWEELNEKFNNMCTSGFKFNMSEEGFQKFLKTCAKKNPSILMI